MAQATRQAIQQARISPGHPFRARRRSATRRSREPPSAEAIKRLFYQPKGYRDPTEFVIVDLIAKHHPRVVTEADDEAEKNELERVVSQGSTTHASTAEPSTSTSTGDDADATGDDVTTTDEPDFAAPTLMPGNGVAAVAAMGVLAYML